jgi:two-component sensor histidine kinase
MRRKGEMLRFSLEDFDMQTVTPPLLAGAARDAAHSAAVARSIVDTIADPLLVLDGDLRIVMASRSFVRVFGDSGADVTGKKLAELEQGRWDLAALRLRLECLVLDGAPIEDFLVEDDFAGLGPRIFKLDARRIDAPADHGGRILLVFEDVTKAVAADRHKDLLAAELAHRIKNSLSVISGLLTLEIGRGLAPCREGYRAMQTRLAAVASLYDLIARSNAFGPVDMRTYLAGIANGLRASLLGREGTIEIAVDAEPLAISTDHAVSVGLLVNELGTNAIKHAFPQGRGRIVLGFHRRDGELMLSVRDDGVGLDAFGGRSGDAGLGLRFVDAFVQQIGGRLLRSSAATGTTMAVRLPTSILAA